MSGPECCQRTQSRLTLMLFMAIAMSHESWPGVIIRVIFEASARSKS